ncbi:MAG: hypothetical protein COB14_03360 [Alphaproteobacteria bacterium]|nr:MAG: hypothetical protein COB14_03360 [Alphaproteobacteria bacterium]
MYLLETNDPMARYENSKDLEGINLRLVSAVDNQNNLLHKIQDSTTSIGNSMNDSKQKLDNICQHVDNIQNSSKELGALLKEYIETYQ